MAKGPRCSSASRCSTKRATWSPPKACPAARSWPAPSATRQHGCGRGTGTEQTQAQAQATRAEEASRVKDDFLATVSHELRTPLNAVLGWASMLDGTVADAKVAKGLAVIHRNARAQAKIIEDILDVSRIITGNLRLELLSVDLVKIVRDAMEVVRPSADAKSITLARRSPPEPCLLIADPDRLQQVVWNLLSNAVKFTDAAGTITADVTCDGARVPLVVTHTGRGIAPRFLPLVFDRFKQADGTTTRRVGGLGLAIAIVRHIVELHGGQVRAASDGPGRGATFTVTLPVRRCARRHPTRAIRCAPREELATRCAPR